MVEERGSVHTKVLVMIMIHKISRMVLLATVAVFVFHVLFFWTNSIIDSYFYWAFSQYITTGVYPFAEPFVYLLPTTISPPLYALLLAILAFFPSAQIFLHGFQLLLLGITSFLLYRMVKWTLHKDAAIIIACLFALMPGNLIYTTLILTEIPAQFFLTVFIYFFMSFVRTKRILPLALAVLIASLMTLMKYSFIVYVGIAFLFFIFRKPRHIRLWFMPAIGMTILLLWITINFRITGVWGLSDTKGVQLYNQAVWSGGLLPDESDPTIKILRMYIPKNVDVKKAYWDLQGYILPHTENRWHEVDTILGNVATAAVKAHPIRYLIHSIDLFIRFHGGGRPYWNNLSSFGKPQDQYPVFCDHLGKFQTCHPLIQTQWSTDLWNRYVDISTAFYAIIFPIFGIAMFIPSLIYALLFGKKPVRILGLLYLAGMVPIAMYVHLDTRYTLPFYPLMILITVPPVISLYKFIRRLTQKNYGALRATTKL